MLALDSVRDGEAAGMSCASCSTILVIVASDSSGMSSPEEGAGGTGGTGESELDGSMTDGPLLLSVGEVGMGLAGRAIDTAIGDGGRRGRASIEM